MQYTRHFNFGHLALKVTRDFKNISLPFAFKKASCKIIPTICTQQPETQVAQDLEARGPPFPEQY